MGDLAFATGVAYSSRSIRCKGCGGKRGNTVHASTYTYRSRGTGTLPAIVVNFPRNERRSPFTQQRPSKACRDPFGVATDPVLCVNQTFSNEMLKSSWCAQRRKILRCLPINKKKSDTKCSAPYMRKTIGVPSQPGGAQILRMVPKKNTRGGVHQTAATKRADARPSPASATAGGPARCPPLLRPAAGGARPRASSLARSSCASRAAEP